MTKYISEERFIVSSNSKEAIKNYADNYDRIFGKKAEHVDGYIVPNCPGCTDGAPEKAPDSDAIECRLRSYVNFIPAGPTAVINGVEDVCEMCLAPIEAGCDCDDHDAACAKLCTEDAACDCGARV